MQFISVVIFALCAVTAIDALRCHQSGWGGSARTLVDVPERYHWADTGRKFGACYVTDKGARGFKERAFRGDIDYVCVNRTWQWHGYGVWCYCATDGCNAEMPNVEVHMSPVVNCMSPGGKAYQCGGDSYYYGNVCGTIVKVFAEIPEIKTSGTCVISLGEKGCMTRQYSSYHYSYCMGKVKIVKDSSVIG